MSLIDRQAAIKLADFMNSGRIGSNPKYCWEKAKDTIRALPSVQPERKKGKWLIGTVEHKFTHEQKEARQCSECGAIYFHYARQEDIEDEIPNFCPNCGADMREGDTT